MRILPALEGIAEALQTLKAGGVVAHATETCYGLACDLRNPEAVAKLFAIKQRPVDQPVSALFVSVDEAKKWVEWNDEAEKLALEYLPGPLTLILPLRKIYIGKIFPLPPAPPPKGEGGDISGSFSPSPAGGRGQGIGETLGVRISSHPLAQNLAKEVGSPLSTTSANIHGQKNPYSAEEIVLQFTGGAQHAVPLPDLILDSGTLPPTLPSTVINLAAKDSPIVRKGSV